MTTRRLSPFTRFREQAARDYKVWIAKAMKMLLGDHPRVAAAHISGHLLETKARNAERTLARR